MKKTRKISLSFLVSMKFFALDIVKTFKIDSILNLVCC